MKPIKSVVNDILKLFHQHEQEHDCSADRILTKRELLESQMPLLRTLVLGDSQPQQS